jgi:hypothetical protein
VASTKKIIPLYFPAAGIVRRYAYSRQAPYSTPDAQNVWPDSAGVPTAATQSDYIRERGGSRPGLAKALAAQIGGGAPIRALGTIQFITGSQLNRRLVGISNGALSMEDSTGAWASVGGTFNSQKQLQMAERNQILYIADHSDVVANSSSTNQPKKLVPTGPTVSNWTASDGTIPYGSITLVNWRDRAVFGGGTTSPFGVFASRQGDFEDFDYSETDTGAAWALNLADAGQMGDSVMALVPHSDDCLVIFCSTSTWIMRGDPGFGGTVDNISRHVGCLGQNAWCITPEGFIVWLSGDGLYMMPGGCSATTDGVKSLSREKMPEELV